MIYFDNSATTFFKPKAVIDSVVNCIESLNANPGRASHGLAIKASEVVYLARCSIASFIGLKNEQRVIFTQNCSHALNLAILGLIKDGEHVITTCFEHNSVLRPLFAKSKTVDISIIKPTAPRSTICTKQIENAIRKNTSVVIVNHVSNVNGQIQPIEEIGRLCKKHGIPLIVDGAQSVGYLDIDMQAIGISMLAIAPHKGLHAVMGVGALACSEEIELSHIVFGGTGTQSHELSQPTSTPDGYEVGTLPLCAISSISPAISWCLDTKTQNASTISYLTQECIKRLEKIEGVSLYTPKSSTNGIIAFNLKSFTSSYVCDYLYQEHEICARCGLHCAPLMHEYLHTKNHGCVRISLGADNNEEEIFRLITAIKKL